MRSSLAASLRIMAIMTIASAVVLMVGVSTADALQPPRPGELSRLRSEGALAASVARARALGNDRLAPDMAARLSTPPDRFGFTDLTSPLMPQQP